MNKENAKSSITEAVRQCQQELQELGLNISDQTKRSVQLRNQLARLQGQLEHKHGEATYTFQADLQRLEEELQRKCLTQKHYSANLQSNLGRMQREHEEAKLMLEHMEERLTTLKRMVG